MLYRLTDGNGLEPLEFQDFPGSEKDLENLLAENLFNKLFEQACLFPFHQERRLQPEADVYALNEAGVVVIFELKRKFTRGGGHSSGITSHF